MSIERIVFIVCVLAAGIVGFLLGDYRGEIKLQDVQLQAAVLRAHQGRQQYEKLVAALDALSAARRDSVDLRADAERVRRAAEVRARRTSAAACSAERAAITACEGLLRESVGLLAEGRELLQETAGVHDAAIGVK